MTDHASDSQLDSAPPVAVVRDLEHRFGSHVALSVASLTLGPGTVAVLGPNGAGKTTLLRLLATVVKPQTGSVRMGGLDPTDPAECAAIRRRLGFAMQSPVLPERMQVGQFIDYVAALKEIGPRRRRIRWQDWVLAEAGLDGVRRDRIATLSGGMRRRLVTAQAMLGHPDIVILDEPLVSLDADHRSQLVRAVAASADRRTTIVATHHVDELASVCRSAVVLVAGRPVFVGPPSDLAAYGRGRTFETTHPVALPGVRAMGPDRFRVVDDRPDGAVEVEPTAHDGYLALLADNASLPT